MEYCVIIKLSKSFIEFHYQLHNDPVEVLHLDGEPDSRIPLAFYSSGEELILGTYALERARQSDTNAYTNYFELIKDPSKSFNYAGYRLPIKQLLYIGIEQLLSKFLREKALVPDWDISSNRQAFPLWICYDSDIENNEKRFVSTVFIEAGYQMYQTISIDKYLIDHVSPNNKSKLLLKGLNGDLYISYCDSKNVFNENVKIIKGLGRDPRFEICANTIYEQVRQANPYISALLEDNREELIKEAKDVLKKTTPIVIGSVHFSNGEIGEYNIQLSKLNAKIKEKDASSLLSSLDSFVSQLSISYADIDVILDGDLNSEYYLEQLGTKFITVIPIRLLDSQQTWESVFEKIANQEIVPQRFTAPTPRPNRIVDGSTPNIFSQPESTSWLDNSSKASVPMPPMNQGNANLNSGSIPPPIPNSSPWGNGGSMPPPPPPTPNSSPRGNGGSMPPPPPPTLNSSPRGNGGSMPPPPPPIPNSSPRGNGGSMPPPPPPIPNSSPRGNGGSMPPPPPPIPNSSPRGNGGSMPPPPPPIPNSSPRSNGGSMPPPPPPPSPSTKSKKSKTTSSTHDPAPKSNTKSVKPSRAKNDNSSEDDLNLVSLLGIDRKKIEQAQQKAGKLAQKIKGEISQRIKEVTCPDCGHLVSPNMNVCPNCGCPLKNNQSSTKKSNAKLCPDCGQPVSKDSKVCPNCGCPLK